MQFPKVTQSHLDQVEREKLDSALTAVAFVGGLTAANYGLNAPGGKLVQLPLKMIFTGVDVKPSPTGRAHVAIPRTSIFAAFLPSPVGYIPPEAYGLHPEVWKRTFTPLKPGQKPPLFSASEERILVYEASQVVEGIARRAAPASVRDASGGEYRYAIPAGNIPVTVAELDWLKTLPPGLSPAQAIVPELDRRREDLIGGNTKPLTKFLEGLPFERRQQFGAEFRALSANPLAPKVNRGSTRPALVTPKNFAAIANAARKEGIDLELITERADP